MESAHFTSGVAEDKSLKQISPNAPGFSIQLAEDSDFENIFKIWTEGLSQSFEPNLIDEDRLRTKFEKIFKNRDGIFNYWVAKNDVGEILGWQSLNKCTVNPVKEDHFAESSTYVKREYRKFGIGESLLKYMINTALESRLRYITAYINAENKSIRKITQSLGFIEIGALPLNSKQSGRIDKLFIIKPL